MSSGLHDAFNIILVQFSVTLNMVNHALHLLLKRAISPSLPSAFNTVTPRNHAQGWETLFNKIEPGIVDSEEINRVYAFNV